MTKENFQLTSVKAVATYFYVSEICGLACVNVLNIGANEIGSLQSKLPVAFDNMKN